MTSGWTWDETLFAGTAAYYARGRLPYAPGLVDGLASALALDGRSRLLDVGCGPGTVTLPFARVFDEVVGLDADADMLAEAERIASERRITNATWVHLRAEELPAGLGLFRVATFAASLHWMDRLKVFSTVRHMLEPGGAAVHVDNVAYRTPAEQMRVEGDALAGAAGSAHPPPPDEAVADLGRRYLGAERRAGQSVCHGTPGDEDAVFRDAGFSGPERVIVPDGRVIERTVDDEVARTLSSSSTAPHLFGDRLPEFEADLRRLLASASPSGLFSMHLPGNELKIWRPVTVDDGVR